MNENSSKSGRQVFFGSDYAGFLAIGEKEILFLALVSKKVFVSDRVNDHFTYGGSQIISEEVCSCSSTTILKSFKAVSRFSPLASRPQR